jgi:hypothetical protein
MDKLKITFGIITTANTQTYLNDVIGSIRSQNIPDDSYEILIVGNCDLQNTIDIKVIPFDDTARSGWTTRKKNIVTKESKFENIVYIHDYIAFSEGWYKGFLEFGTDWDICMNRVNDHKGDRLLDWMGLPDDRVYGNVVFPYDYEGSEGMYINGHYWIAKRYVMEQFPLNEDFLWGEGEDIEWSKRVLGGFPPLWLKNHNEILNKEVRIKKHKYVFNPHSSVFTLKHKEYSTDFYTGYDLHSGNESRPLESIPENYEYLKYRQ